MGVLNYTTAKINELLDKIDKAPEKIENGKTPVFVTGTTTTLDPGLSATAEVVQDGVDDNGTPKYKINFGVPKGLDGASGGGGGTADSVQWNNILNMPSWVNSATKPTYTASEVGALPVGTTIPSKTSQLTNDSKFLTSADFKTINGESIVGSGDIFLSGTGGIAEAPKDGETYGRNNGLWVKTSQMEEAPTDDKVYARKNKGWANVLESTEKALLNNYIKDDLYTAIEPTDSINSAIAKLEAGLSNMPSSQDDYYLPSALFNLSNTATSEEIITALGGEDKKAELYSAISNGKHIYINKSTYHGVTPVFSFNLANLTACISFIKLVNSMYNVEFVYLTIGAAKSSIKIKRINGYFLDKRVTNLTSESTSDEISYIFGSSLSKLKEFEKYVEDVNLFFTKLYADNVEFPSYFPLSICVSKDESSHTIGISGLPGKGFAAFFALGHLIVNYDVVSNTYSCIRIDSPTPSE